MRDHFLSANRRTNDLRSLRLRKSCAHRDYVYGDSIDEVLTMTRGGSTYYYHYDGLGSVTDLTNAAGAIIESYTYDVYGQPSQTSTVGNPYLFTGRRLDPESGLYYYRSRMYSPTIGRFLQRDPLGYVDSMNLFSYTGNNPVNFLDPLGLCSGPFGSGYGEEALNWYAQQWAQSGNPLWAVPGFFAALWTPDTYWKTGIVLGAAGGAAVWGRMPAWWQYYPKGNPGYQSPWLTRGTNFRPPYSVGREAQRALNLPAHRNPGTAVRRININPGEQIAGPRTPRAQTQWGHNSPGTGQEYFRGPNFPN